MNYDVFISYSSKRLDAAKAVRSVLEDNGIKCWMAPDDIPAGAKYGSTVISSIKECKALVFLFSEESALSPWVESELNIAFTNRKPIISYKIDASKLEDYDELYIMLNNRPCVDSGSDFNAALAELVKVVAGVVGVVPQPAPMPATPDGKQLDEWNALGDQYYNKGDYKQAIEMYTKAAEYGHAEAIFNIGYCFTNGQGVEKDIVEGTKLCRESAERGYIHAQYCMGYYYEIGSGVTKDMVEAARWYRRAAERGYARAQCNLGVCYEYGRGVEKNMVEAAKWYEKSAEQGNARAQCYLGECYANGQGVENNIVEAAKWYYKAAEQGFARAQNNLGCCYRAGEGVVKDVNEAIKWFQRSAEQGNKYAQYNLGVCYNDGIGVSRDLAVARIWYSKSAAQGYEPAQKALNSL